SDLGEMGSCKKTRFQLHPKRVFQTVKNLNLMRQQRSSAAPSPLNIPGSNQNSCFTSGRSSRVGTPRSNSIYGSETGSGIFLDNRTSSILEGPDDGSEDSNKRPPGTPGTPGSRDLEAALHRLSLRRDNYLSEKRFFEEERERKLAYLGKEEEKGGVEGSGGPGTPTESLLSFSSHPSLGSIWSGYSITARSYLPDKLQIVKPLEGDYYFRDHKSTDPLNMDKEKDNLSFQKVFLISNENLKNNEHHNKKQRHDYNIVFLNSEAQISSTQTEDKHPNQFLVFHNQREPQIFLSASPNVNKCGRSFSQLELRRLSSSATLHAWQQLAQPHMGALLDHRPGVVTKGFRTLEQDREQEQGWQLDQPEEDEVSRDSSTSLPGESSAPIGSLYSTSAGSICCNKAADIKGNNQIDELNGAICGPKEAVEGKDGHVANMPLLFSCSSSSSPIPSCLEISRHTDLKELQALQPTTVDRMPEVKTIFTKSCQTSMVFVEWLSAYWPVAYLAFMVSHSLVCLCTQTFLYLITVVYAFFKLLSLVYFPSPAVAICQSSSAIGTSTHTSTPVPFSVPHTPSYTPCCTPRRLSLSLSLSESSTNLRDSTKTTSTSLGLVRLLLEHGISASVYDPCSWDRGLGPTDASTPGVRVQVQRSAAESGEKEVRPLVKRPDTLLLQSSTPPSSPHEESASSTTARPAFQFSPSKEDPPFYDAFLASKPARTILREVLMDLEREYEGKMDEDGQNEVSNLGLVDKLKRFRTLSPVSASVSSGSALLAPFSSSGLGGGLPGLNAGLRRNRSYPAMVGASMAMKDPGGPPCTLIPQTMQTSHSQDPEEQTEETGKVQTHPSVVRKAIHIPQTLHALEPATPQTIIQRHKRPNKHSKDSNTQDQHSEGQTRTW
ncbi:hypothetical protein XENOCAPTIV_002567, partial [Xenoophorus captivus]